MEPARRRGHSFIDEESDDSRGVAPVALNAESSDGPPMYDPNMTFEDDDNAEGDEMESFTEENEEEYFSRSRSRSRSVHENDEAKVKVLSQEEIKLQVEKSRNQCTERTIEAKTGPLQHREVVALQRGLTEATHQKAENERLEEQAEREAAMREKEQRSLSTAGSVAPVQIGSDPMMRRVKILLLGDSNVGKTSIISRLTTGDFKNSLAHTVGVDYKAKKLHIDGEMLQVQLWDTAGQEKFRQITTSYYRGVNGIMLCFDVSSRESYERVAHWMVGIKKHASKDVHVLLVANKTDLRETSETGPDFVTSKEVKTLASKCKVPYVETSALTAENVEECLLTLVRSIVDDLSLSFPGPGSPPRLSLDFAAIAKSRESKDSNHSHGSGVSGDKKGEKCVVS